MSGDWLRKNLARPIDGASLGLFRILWGLLMVWESIRKLPKADGMYSPTFFHFKYEHFYFVEPLPEIWMMQVEITLMLIAAIFVTIGWFYRPASAVFLVIFHPSLSDREDLLQQPFLPDDSHWLPAHVLSGRPLLSAADVLEEAEEQRTKCAAANSSLLEFTLTPHSDCDPLFLWGDCQNQQRLAGWRTCSLLVLVEGT